MWLSVPNAEYQTDNHEYVDDQYNRRYMKSKLQGHVDRVHLLQTKL